MTFSLALRRASAACVTLLVSGLVPPAARADGRTVTLSAFQIDGREQYVPTGQLPASESFDLELPAPDPTLLQARVEIWPRQDGDPADGDRCRTPRRDREQYHALAMTAVGDAATRLLRARVPPLQLGREFCFLVTRTRSVAPSEAKATGAWVASTHEDLVQSGRFRQYPALELELRKAIEAGLEFNMLGDPAGRAAAATRAAPRAATAFYYSPTAASYLRALGKREAAILDLKAANASGKPQQITEANRAAAEVEQAIEAQKTTVVTGLADAVTGAVQDVRFDLGTPAVPLPASAATLDPNNFASVDAGVAVGFPLVSGPAGFRTQVLPYVGLNLYSTAVERNVPLDQLTGSTFDKYFRQRVSLTVGVTLESPSSPGWTVKPVLLGKSPLIALGYRLTQYTRVSAGALFFLLGSRSPAEDRSSLGFALFVGYSIDFDVLTLLRTGLSKV